MIIRTNKRDRAAFSSKDLFCSEELEGIELNGGDDDFGDEMLFKRSRQQEQGN